MTEGAQKRLGFSAIGGRKAKAEKIAAILAAAGHPLTPDRTVLDLGCGSGEIAAHLSTLADVTCCDAVDQRVHGRALRFAPAGPALPFADASFDVVVSNHVIEHTPDAARHLREIRRMLRPGGVCYLATPNRWWPWEFHARVPLLHYLPWRQFSRLGSALGRLSEPVRLLSLHGLTRLLDGLFVVDVWHPRVLHDPERFAIALSGTTAALLRALPSRLLNAGAALQPTLILVLRPR